MKDVTLNQRSLSQKSGTWEGVDCWREGGLEVDNAASRNGPGTDVAVATLS